MSSENTAKLLTTLIVNEMRRNLAITFDVLAE